MSVWLDRFEQIFYKQITFFCYLSVVIGAQMISAQCGEEQKSG